MDEFEFDDFDDDEQQEAQQKQPTSQSPCSSRSNGSPSSRASHGAVSLGAGTTQSSRSGSTKASSRDDESSRSSSTTKSSRALSSQASSSKASRSSNGSKTSSSSSRSNGSSRLSLPSVQPSLEVAKNHRGESSSVSGSSPSTTTSRRSQSSLSTTTTTTTTATTSQQRFAPRGSSFLRKGGRTRHQRLALRKQQQLEDERTTSQQQQQQLDDDDAVSPGRRVRFSQSPGGASAITTSSSSTRLPSASQESVASSVTNSVLSAAASAPAASTNTKPRPHTTKPPLAPTTTQQQKKRPRRAWRPETKSSWMKDMEETDNKNGMGPPPSRKRKQQPVVMMNGDTTAGKQEVASNATSSNSVALQRGRIGGHGYADETGDWQLLNDECLFLCSSLMSQQKQGSDNGSSNLRTKKKPMTLLESAAELAFLVSCPSNRQTLLFRNNGTVLRTGGTAHDDSALQALWDLLATFATTSTSSNASTGSNSKTAAAVVPQTITAAADDASSLDHGKNNKKRRTTVEGVPSPPPTTRSAQHDPKVLQAISMIFYFISLDCTLSEQGIMSSNEPAAARRLRMEFLTRPAVMQGLATLVTLHPFVATLRGNSNKPVTTTLNFDADDDQFSVASSLAGDASVLSVAESTQSSGSVDPTKAGRMRRKRRRLLSQQSPKSGLSPIAESPNKAGRNDDVFSFPSMSSPGSTSCNNNSLDNQSVNSLSSDNRRAAKALEQLERASIRMHETLPQSSTGNENGDNRHKCGCSTNIALLALTNIITGKGVGDEKSCIDDDDYDSSSSPEGEENDDDNNPLLKTNRLLGESGIIPLLSQALADTLAAVLYQLGQQRHGTSSGDGVDGCAQCATFLQERVASLISLVDGACLLNESNRESFCLEGYTSEAGGYLIVGLVAVLQTLLLEGERSKGNNESKLFQGVWGDIGLECLRGLTSLTHENATACKEFESKNDFSLGAPDANTHMTEKQEQNGKGGTSGLEVLARLLYRAVHGGKHDESSSGVGTKVRYDSIIFCLNCLANCVESGASTEALGKMRIAGSAGDDDNDGPPLLFVEWLTRWLVEETASFRKAVEESSFGSSPCKHSERRLDQHEDERLVTAGNGFVLLACIMIRSPPPTRTKQIFDKSGGDDDAMSSKERILAQLPGETVTAKLAYVKNTLKAFCNFYHYSIGDLSVAVVAPVRKLIDQL